MKISRKNLYQIIVISITLSLLGYFFSVFNETDDCIGDCELLESKQGVTVIEKSQLNSGVEKETIKDGNLKGLGKETQLESLNKFQSKKVVEKKHYDDDWCDAKRELSESDYHFAQTEYNDWLETIGNARSRPRPQNIAKYDIQESSYPNSSLIESYEALPINQLESLALQGDKWAMVAFVQNRKASTELKDEVAKKLMVTGASYYALQHFVMNALLEAQVSADKNDVEEIKAYVTDALAYVYWGLEHYNDGGLTPFIAVAFSDRIKAQIPIDSIVANSTDAVNKKVSRLTQWVDEQRETQGISMPKASKAARTYYARNMAAREFSFEQQIELLRSLDITNSKRLASNPCMKKYVEDMREKSK